MEKWTIRLSSTLISPGQDVSVELSGSSSEDMPDAVWLHRHAEQPGRDAEAIPLRWRDGVGRATLQPAECGNYFVSPDRDPVPDGSAYRYFAVVDDTYHLFRFAITLTPEDYSENVHGNFLTADYWPFLASVTSEQFDRLRLFERRYGDVITPHLFPVDLAAGAGEGDFSNPNWYRYDDDQIESLLAEFRRRWTELGFERADAFCTYCHSTSLARVAGRMGFELIGGLVSEHNHRDGAWEINHSAMPSLPYFPADENFRIPVPPSPDRVMMVHQYSSCPVLGHDYFLSYSLDISCLNREETSFELGEECWRVFDQMDAFVDASRTLGGPDLTSIGIERVGAGTVVAYNRQAIEKVARQIRAGEKVAVANGRGLRDYYLRHCPTQPVRISGHTDVFVGNNFYGKPIVYPDFLVVDEPRLHVAFVHPTSEPHYHYARLAEDGSDACYVDDLETASVDDAVDDVRVTVDRTDDGCTVSFAFSALREMKAMPLCAWDLPVRPEETDWTRGELSLHAVKSPFTDGWNLVAVGPVKPGPVRWDIAVRGSAVQPDQLEVRREHWVAKEFPNSDPPHTYVAKLSSGELQLDVEFPRGREVTVESADGQRDSVVSDGRHRLDLTELQPYVRLWNVHAEEVAIRGEHFSPLVLGDFDFTADSECLQAWFRDEFLGAGDRILLAHECFRERGYGQRAHAVHENHVPVGGNGITLDPSCVDYSQAWAPGHSGWIQPQWLVVTVEGLRAYTGKRLTVFLHCYSPDGVDRAYHVMANENLLAGRFWRVPAGFEGRFDPGGILAWDVPADIVDQDRVNLLISPLRKPWHMIHHWVRDGGFASILNDVWVVQRGDGSQ